LNLKEFIVRILFEIISVMNPRQKRCQKQIYSIVSHRNVNKSIITTWMMAHILQNIEMHICYVITYIPYFYLLQNNWPPWVKVNLKCILVGYSKDSVNKKYLPTMYNNQKCSKNMMRLWLFTLCYSWQYIYFHGIHEHWW
jgi:hypothetical protein